MPQRFGNAIWVLACVIGALFIIPGLYGATRVGPDIAVLLFLFLGATAIFIGGLVRYVMRG